VSHRAVEPELQRWVAHDCCPAEPRTVEQRTTPSRGGADHTATLLLWGPCAGGAEVQLWKLNGAGHGWPGGHVPLPREGHGPGDGHDPRRPRSLAIRFALSPLRRARPRGSLSTAASSRRPTLRVIRSVAVCAAGRSAETPAEARLSTTRRDSRRQR